MTTDTLIIHKAELAYQDLSGVNGGRAIEASVLGAGSTARLQASFVEMEDVVIPRQARIEELLYIVSGSIDIEENGKVTRVEPGDTVYLSAESAPTYHVGEKTLILAAYLP